MRMAARKDDKGADYLHALGRVCCLTASHIIFMPRMHEYACGVFVHQIRVIVFCA
jgi:hypothetical protein